MVFLFEDEGGFKTEEGIFIDSGVFWMRASFSLLLCEMAFERLPAWGLLSKDNVPKTNFFEALGVKSLALVYCGVNTLSSAKATSVSQARMSEGDVSRCSVYVESNNLWQTEEGKAYIFRWTANGVQFSLSKVQSFILQTRAYSVTE